MTQGEFDHAYRAHRQGLRALALRLTRSGQDADDLLSATFERSLSRYSTFRPGSNMRGWLTRIMTRLFIDQCRRRRGTAVPLDQLQVAAPQPEEEPWWRSLPDEEVRQALVELPGDLRRLIEGHSLRGETYQGLALTTGLPVATVGSRLHRTRRRLRARLQRRLEERQLQ